MGQTGGGEKDVHYAAQPGAGFETPKLQRGLF
jgi:hypothetical protein